MTYFFDDSGSFSEWSVLKDDRNSVSVALNDGTFSRKGDGVITLYYPT